MNAFVVVDSGSHAMSWWIALPLIAAMLLGLVYLLVKYPP